MQAGCQELNICEDLGENMQGMSEIAGEVIKAELLQFLITKDIPRIENFS